MLNSAVSCLLLIILIITGCTDANATITGRSCAVGALPTKTIVPLAEPQSIPPVLEITPPPVVKLGADAVGTTLTMEVSGYTSAKGWTDSRPCEAADQSNICERKLKGELLCAASRNIPRGSKLHVQGLGTCTVVDRMSHKYTNNVDWYFGQDAEGSETKKLLALNVGRKDRTVKIISIPTPK